MFGKEGVVYDLDQNEVPPEIMFENLAVYLAVTRCFLRSYPRLGMINFAKTFTVIVVKIHVECLSTLLWVASVTIIDVVLILLYSNPDHKVLIKDRAEVDLGFEGDWCHNFL